MMIRCLIYWFPILAQKKENSGANQSKLKCVNQTTSSRLQNEGDNKLLRRIMKGMIRT